MAYFRETMKNLQAMAEAAKAAQTASPSSPGSAAQAAQVTPEAVAKALEQAVKSDNGTNVNIAIRLAQLAARYPQRAA